MMTRVEELDCIRRQERLSIAALCERSGVSHGTFISWRRKAHSPRLDLFEACVNAMGYKLEIVKNGH